ncbi:hypothetical protein ABOM_012132 [Aspergillus bombycis]|uniref:C2H2-type domain-containing protein n=1 Tax=Aspergillus bombycis TaxID=109264 RepID=A0A1F7ZIW9_9EURO|nr:hypothetical protein ABOM_012132 [Aspergillus bombycis]OGM39396.1 hypothetical protein ABOM_012132 [Aspergillus bombycis]
MKRRCSQRGQLYKESSRASDSVTSSSESDDHSDATVETDLTEPSSPPPAKKQRRADKRCYTQKIAADDGLGELYNDPLDDTGVDLSGIPEDFDKAKGTIQGRERVEDRWKRFCVIKAQLEPNESKWQKPEDALRRSSNNDKYRFLGWTLKLDRGKNGQKLKQIHKASSLMTDWKNLRLYYQRLTKTQINDQDSKEILAGIRYLVFENGLDTQPGKKTPVYIEDIAPLNETILSTQEKKFYLGLQRIQVCLFNSLALFTVHRQNALLSLQFKDLQISLQKDPHGGPPILNIELTPEGTKKFLGITKLTTFCLLEVIYGPSLVLCPHTLLFGILFYARAFRNGLRSKAQLRKLFIRKRCEQLVIPFDPAKADWYVFCKTELVDGVPTAQWEQAMTNAMMSRLLVIFGEIHGWLGMFHAHQFRYGSGKIINESAGWVSKEQHMLIMKHASSRTFLEHYHPLRVDTDMIRIICGLDPDVELMRAVSRQSRWRDTRRPRYLTDQQRAQIEDHPELEEARCKLSKARAQYEDTQKPGLLPCIQRLEKEVKNTRVRLLRALRHKVRENFDEEQAFLDIEAQLSGTAVEEEDEDRSPLEDNMHPLQLYLVQCLVSYPISNSLEDEWNRRDTGADAVAQYCGVFEGGPRRGRPKRKASDSAASDSPSSQPHKGHRAQNSFDRGGAPDSTRDERLRMIKEHIQESKQPRHCFQCFADEKQPDDIRFKKFYDGGCVTRHFDAIHLDKGSFKCEWCEVVLLHRMAFQRHAQDVHRVRSRWRCPEPANPCAS